MRSLLAAAFLTLTTSLFAALPAHAGGFGIITTGGIHTDRVYYYYGDDLQALNRQNRPNVGGGVELILGDRDDKVQGFVRGYYVIDAPQVDPATAVELGATYTIRDETREIGMVSTGVQWTVYGDPMGFSLYLTSVMGSGIATTDNLEFLLLEGGAGGSYHLDKKIALFGELALGTRYRKAFYPNHNAYVGVRYLFD